VSTDTSQPNANLIDSYITDEIPDPSIDPLGYALLAEHMVHGPCGYYNQNSPCMKRNQCSKHYPKLFNCETVVDMNGFAVYKQSNNDRFVMKSNIKLDNRWVVPYNMTLLKKYQAHINVEWCNKSLFIKYLFKYVTKGPDRNKLYLNQIINGQDTPIDEETNTRNEVKEYLDARFICPYDSCWRIFGFEIHQHFPPVERLPVHLPNENYITYHANANMSQILSQEFLRRTMLTEWFVANQRHENARSLTYPDFPSEWRWDEKKRLWEHKQLHGKIGRIHFVHPSAGERYYVRMLLMVVKGAQNYESLRTYDHILHPTFKEACRARGLLEDDQEWYNAFDEATSWATSNQLRQLFVTMLLFCEVGDELSFFEKVWRLLADDIQYNTRQMLNHPEYQIPDETLKKTS
jgi:hypothetical protein